MKYAISFSALMLTAALLTLAAGRVRADSDLITADATREAPYVVSARTMDYGNALGSKLLTFSPSQSPAWSSKTPSGGAGKRWVNAYGFAGVVATALGDRKVFDGMNSAGLSAAALWMKEPSFGAGTGLEAEGDHILAASDVVAWILGQFTTVAQVKDHLQEVDVWYDRDVLPHPIHLVVHDASGASLVVEWVNGQPQFFDSQSTPRYAGVLTNEPGYTEQMGNLDARLAVFHFSNQDVMNEETKQWTEGAGFLGAEGDPSSQSRFVRLYLLNRYAYATVTDKRTFNETTNGARWGVQRAMQIINRVNSIHGTMTHLESGEAVYPHTIWTLIRDHGNRKLYFRPYAGLRYASCEVKVVKQMAPGTARVVADLATGITAGQLDDLDQNPAATAEWDDTETLFTLIVNIPVAPADLGRTGRMYIFARQADGALWSWTGRGWRQQTGSGALLSCWRGKLAMREFMPFDEAEVAFNWLGAEIYAGYSVGSRDADMFLRGHQNGVYFMPWYINPFAVIE